MSLAFAACGETESGLADPTFRGQPLGILQGLVGAENAAGIDGTIAFALLWSNARAEPFDPFGLPRFESPELTCTGEPSTERMTLEEGIFRGTGYFAHPGWIGQTVNLEANFPLRFQLLLEELPPTEAMFDLEEMGNGSGVYATASIIVYVDTDRDGIFDAPSADRPADEILAFAPQLNLVYLDGTITDSAVPQGFSLFSWEVDEENGTIEGNVSTLASGFNLTIPASVAERKEAERRVCRTVALVTELGRPLPEDAEPGDIICETDNLRYTYIEARQMLPDRTCALSRPVVRACLEPDAVVPENWPCR